MAQATSHPDRRLISSEDVQGTDVYGAGDEAIGEIDHLLIDKVSGRVVYAVMSFGGFLGLGHSHYPIPWAALKYDTNLGGYRTGIVGNSCAMRLSSVMTYWKIGIGRRGRMSTTASLAIGVSRCRREAGSVCARAEYEQEE